MSKDYYKILGVARSATFVDIKRAYKKLAIKYQPDIKYEPEAQVDFKEIREAYNVLSDEKKRQIYDHLGEDGLKGYVDEGNNGDHTFSGDLKELFPQFCDSGGNPFEDFMWGKQQHTDDGKDKQRT